MPGRILIADDLATNRILLKAKLTAAHYCVLVSPSRAEAPGFAAARSCDIVLVDLGHPTERALAVCRALKADPATRTATVVGLAPAGATALRREALEAGADDVLSRRTDDALFLARIRSLMRARHHEAELGLRGEAEAALGFAEAAPAFDRPGLVAILSQVEAGVTWRHALAPLVRDRVRCLSPDTAFESISDSDTAADVYLVGAGTGERHEGLRLIADLRSRADTRGAGVVAVLAAGDAAGAAAALDLGADDVVEEPFDAAELALRIRFQLRRKARADRLRRQISDGLRLAMTDPLTGLANRRYALTHLARVAAQSSDTGRPFAVMVLDLDRFKRINDSFGHAAGDAVLREVARRIAANLRTDDLAARLGGEEFLVVMADTDAETGRAAAERLRRAVGRLPCPVPGLPEPLAVTVSIGVAIGGKRDPASVDALVENADRALYNAKAEGRDQVTLGLSA
jgi:two-component system, cell cycle response regulator